MSSSWDSLAALANGCVACAELAATRANVVFGDRPAVPQCDLVLLGEAPGSDEDATGRPFVGRSGQLLDQLLEEAGVQRAGVGVVNVLKCRPPRNRKPSRGEIANCSGFLERQLLLLDPLVLVALGGTATEVVMGRGARLTQLRGADHQVGGRSVVVTYHPSAALRFGPSGVPRAALAADLVHAARRAAQLRAERGPR